MACSDGGNLDGTDTTAPVVSLITPAGGATGVAINSAITVTFAEEMDPASLTSTTFAISGVTGTVSCQGNTAIFTPQGNFAYNTTYTVVLTTEVRDQAGNPLAADYSWSFTTGPSPDTTAPTVGSTNPADGATGVAVNSAITATFSEAMDPASLTTATFTVSGGVTGTVGYSGTTATFTPSAPLAFATRYTGTLTAGAKDLAGNPLASDHSWSFTTGPAPDTTAPTVGSTTPVDGASGVAVNSVITATFSEAMDPASLTTATFTVSGGVTGTVGYSGTTATFTPSAPLAFATRYTGTLTAGAKDLAGNPLASDHSWGFTTGPAPDTTAPTVGSTTPVDGASGVAINSVITATFSEVMDPASLTTATFTVSGGVTGTVGYSGTTATFTPSGELASGTTFTVTLGTGVKDLAGNPLASNHIWSFTTANVTFTVNSTLDTVDANPGDMVCADVSGNCTLRAAIQEANAFAGPNTIELPAGNYVLTRPGINEDGAATGDLDIRDDLILRGAGAATTVVDGNGLDRVFHLPDYPGVQVTITGITVTGGSSYGIANKGSLSLADAVVENNAGGGIYNDHGTLEVEDTRFSGNICTGSYCGAAIYTQWATVSIKRSTISSNTAGSNGAAIYIATGTMTVDQTSFIGNSAWGIFSQNSDSSLTVTRSILDGNGGGVHNQGTLDISDSTIANSTASGGVDNYGSGTAVLYMTRCTLSVNTGGGVLNRGGTASISNTTISGTIPAQCNAGLHDDRGTVTVVNSVITGTERDLDDSWWCSTYGVNDTNWGGSVTLINTIVSDNGDADCASVAAIGVDATSIDSDGSCGAGITASPLLGPLQDNGGPTWTHALLLGSPAIDAGNPAACAADPVNGEDQRGQSRDATCDIGPYEYP